MLNIVGVCEHRAHRKTSVIFHHSNGSPRHWAEQKVISNVTLISEKLIAGALQNIYPYKHVLDALAYFYTACYADMHACVQYRVSRKSLSGLLVL